MSDGVGSPEWKSDTARLEYGKRKACNGIGFTPIEDWSIAGEGGYLDIAAGGLEFREENFGMQDSQAVSCRICGGLFVGELWIMRQHRLACGWVS